MVWNFFPDRLQVVQALPETEVLEIVGAERVAQECRELLVLPQDRVLEVGTEDVMAVLDLLDYRGKLATHSAVQPLAEDLGDLVRRQPPEPQLAAALEQLVDREVALEDEVAAIFDLGDRVEARQIDLLALFLGELRPQNECPVVEALANDLRAQLVCCRLQCGNVINSQERVVILSIMRCTA